jgi:hypothetical protein
MIQISIAVQQELSQEFYCLIMLPNNQTILKIRELSPSSYVNCFVDEQARFIQASRLLLSFLKRLVLLIIPREEYNFIILLFYAELSAFQFNFFRENFPSLQWRH